ncbi:Protein TIME FOR COFFEE [Acorus calamus]|uniref:Protein TIME FOR COFFEE n=1 Tax=Acorus calamus TaxID=4465 RepID=A0AAV9EI80_ACOCL|nr:Protein TIME FOR COFFEE [Acorus calamus]
MDRNREHRRVAAASAAMNNGGSLSRRRQRSSLRDSPEDGPGELPETGRLRDRTAKKDRDRDRDRSIRSKRRRGDRSLNGSGRDEGYETTDESLDDDDDDHTIGSSASAAVGGGGGGGGGEPPLPPVRLPPPPPPPTTSPSILPSTPSLPNYHYHHHHRKHVEPQPGKSLRTTPATPWKGADEMIGVSVPRKARSASVKRSHEWLVSGGGGGGGCGVVEQIHRQPSTSPARMSGASSSSAAVPSPMSPSSSNASIRKKIKPIGAKQHRPPKVSETAAPSSSSSSIQEIEIEVAEVLYGLTRQFKKEPSKPEQRDANGRDPSKSAVPSSVVTSTSPVQNSSGSPLPVIAAKRKKPRQVVNFEEAGGASSVPAATMAEAELTGKSEAPSPKERVNASRAFENGGGQPDLGVPPAEVTERLPPSLTEVVKLEVDSAMEGLDGKDKAMEAKEEIKTAVSDSDVNVDGASVKKSVSTAENSREEKFSIDLMAPPPAKLSAEMDGTQDLITEHKSSLAPVMDLISKGEAASKAEEVKAEVPLVKMGEQAEIDSETKKTVTKKRVTDLHVDADRQQERDIHGKQSVQKQHQHLQQNLKGPRVVAEPKLEKPAQSETTASLPLQMAVTGWPGAAPPFGYIGQVPSLQGVVPMDGSTGSLKVIQTPHVLMPQTRLKRCATHFHIAQNINYHQQFTRMNPFWPAVGGSGPVYGAKPYNLNVVPPTESVAILGNPMQGTYPGRSAPAGLAPASVQEKGPNGAPAFPIHTSKDRSSAVAVSGYMDTAQRKPTMIQQTPPQTGSAANIMHSPAFIFPVNQQQVAVAAARSNTAVKHVTGSGGGSNAVGPSASASNSTQSSGTVAAAAAAPASMMNFNYPGLPLTEAQYLAILQSNGYPFTIPPQVGAHPSYRPGNLTQTMPYFSAPLYPSQMLHPSLQQQQQQQPPSSSHAQQPSQIQNNTSTSSGSSSSQKHHPQQQQKQGLQGGASGSSHGVFPSSKQQQQTTQQQRPHQPQLPQNQEHEQPGGEEGPSTANSSRISHIYSQSFPIPIHRQNFALVTPATMFPEKQSQQQHEQGVKDGGGGGGAELNPSHQAFALPFNPYGATVTVRPAHQSLDFSIHPMFQSLPEAAVRHGIQICSTAQQHQQQQQKKPKAEEGKPSNDSEEERKLGKAPYPHSLSFSRSMEGDPHQPHMILGNSAIDSVRTFNLINSSTGNNSNRVSTTRPSSTVTTLPPATTAATSVVPQQQQINQQQQQQLSMHRNKPVVASNNDVHAGRVAVVGSSSAMSTCSAVAKFSTGFAQAIIQTNNPNQPIQWKGHSISSMNSLQPQNSMVKKLPPPPRLQQQQQSQQTRAQPVASAQTQISFGVSNSKPMTSPPLSQQLLNHQSPSSASATVGSPTSISKSCNAGGGGSPRASTGSKSGPPPMPPPSAASPVAQPTGKKSVSSSSRKSSPVSSRAMPSILGSVVKPPQQQQQQQQCEIRFSSPYMQAHSSQSSGANYYHQRRPLDQQQQQQQQHHPPPSAGAVTSVPSKVVGAAGNMKGMPSPGMPPPGLQFAAQFAAAAAASGGGNPHTLMSAATFPYIHAMSSVQSVTVKPPDQKPVAGNDNLHACWQPEKR